MNPKKSKIKMISQKMKLKAKILLKIHPKRNIILLLINKLLIVIKKKIKKNQMIITLLKLKTLIVKIK